MTSSGDAVRPSISPKVISIDRTQKAKGIGDDNIAALHRGRTRERSVETASARAANDSIVKTNTALGIETALM